MAITKKDALETLRISWYCFLLHLLCLAWIVGFFSDNLENISPLERMRNGLAAWMEPQALFMMAPYIVGGVIACYIVIVRKKPVFWASTRVLRAIAVWFLASVFAGVMVPLTWMTS